MKGEANPIQRQQERELEKIEICTEIWKGAKEELYLSMRFFDVILNRMDCVQNPHMRGVGTDGLAVYYETDAVLSMYKSNRVLVNRTYLHMVFHCLLLHFQIPPSILDTEGEAYWNLACDIIVESMLDSLNYRSVRKYVPPQRKNLYHRLKEKHPVLTVKNVYFSLREMELSEEMFRKLELEFYADNHSLWKEDVSPKTAMERERQWKEDREKLQTEMETFGKEPSEHAQSVLEQVKVENRERYDYRKFLRKFAVLKEEIKVDMDTFDYIFYHYGMEHYGNMPLIEPQETKEVHKVEDFVIAIDTSMSCKGELVKKFLEETYSVLSESGSFFRKVHVHIIQCDDKVQSDELVTNEDEMRRYMEQFEIKGHGGTDFRPVFAHVNELLRQKEFHRLKGLLYFTDGYGIYPAKRPLYETAFVFMKEDYQDVDVPVWAMKLILESDDLEGLDRKAEITWT